MDYQQLAKIELHCHLDGSVRPQTIRDLAEQSGVSVPDDEQVLLDLLVAPEDCQNLDEYIDCFKLPIQLMQTEEALERISFELYEDAAQENVKYQEVRFAPLLHTRNGLSVEQIIDSVIRGMQRAEQQYDIKGNYILSIVRNMPTDNVKAMLDAGKTWLNNGVVAFDIAGGEQPDFSAKYTEFTRYAAQLGYRLTVHAGEQWYGKNVLDAVTLLGAERIGHGVYIKDHQAAYDMVKQQAVALEVCPTSNVNTKCIESLPQHPIADFYHDGVVVTINTDNRTVSNTTMTDEVRKVMETFDLTIDDYYAIYRHSVGNAFASDSVKQHLLSYIPR
ncbi:adenosine deaminase [Vibrio hippocampi]|uniref:Adenosine deaminase n=1 Tax=Vibrio hippocampi TaxID=654686 RepID=A0ABN8DGD5_9VIBR|nr:adenosine deaminase [Vibrio hippocampi]CAH0525743.1 Adenosine deaminase [Vibrio hippocampi]